ncbi:cytochrome P450 [Amycolatopsis ultiminotia]|uniref:Cytochrome P450 n=1 Tax=Amycolatopsis ultiminotia TaxID=543629 RepID=A0ABP6XGN5_9PSEU
MTTLRLPPGPSVPWPLQAAYALTRPRRGVQRIRAKYGTAFTVQTPVFGKAVVLSDPAEIKQLFQAGADVVDNVEPNLGRVLGPGSMFALAGAEHHKQRKLLVPPFHGRRLAAYEKIMAAATAREFATWPEGREFATLPSMMRITLDIILRAVFGAEGAEFDRLRDLLPRWVKLGSQLAVLPVPQLDWGRWSPWGRFRIMRREYDAIVERLITKAEREGHLDDREDILALMLQARYDDGTPMRHRDVADQLLTLLTAGHETTATTLAWTIERLRRHPAVLQALSDEEDAGGKALREATIVEVQRTRPVIDVVGRTIKAEGYRLGRWTLPEGMVVLVSIALLHEDPQLFPDPQTFDPHRFATAKPNLYHWVPFGGGSRRCLGAAFANMEMNVVLRTLVRDFDLAATTAPGEAPHSRGIANAPGKGGLAVVRRRSTDPASPASAAAAGAG